MLKAHTNAWYERIAEAQSRYFYPWRSSLPPDHGEDSFVQLLKTEISKEDMVLDAGCGSGELTNEVAHWCRSIFGYDRVKGFIEVANAEKHSNATFILHDSKENGNVRLPIEGGCIDYFISSKGPLHWIADAPRVARANAKMAMLVPYSGPTPEWNRLLPDELRQGGLGKDQILDDIETRLASIGLRIEELRTFEVRETFADQREFQRYLTWGKFDCRYDQDDLTKTIGRIFARFGVGEAVPVYRCRLIWKSEFKAA